jgi:hypothetical protein
MSRQLVKSKGTGQRGTRRGSTHHCPLRDKSRLPNMDAPNPRPSSHRFTLGGPGPYGRYAVPGSGSCGCHSVPAHRRAPNLQGYHQHGRLRSSNPFRCLGLPMAAATQAVPGVLSFRTSMHLREGNCIPAMTPVDGRPPPSSPIHLQRCSQCAKRYRSLHRQVRTAQLLTAAVRAAVLQFFVQQSLTPLRPSVYAPIGF